MHNAIQSLIQRIHNIKNHYKILIKSQVKKMENSQLTNSHNNVNIYIKGSLTKQMIMEFILKYNRWPKCNTRKLSEDSMLLKLIIKNECRINLYEAQIPLADWAVLCIQDNPGYDSIITYASIISDRSTAPPAS